MTVTLKKNLVWPIQAREVKKGKEKREKKYIYEMYNEISKN